MHFPTRQPRRSPPGSMPGAVMIQPDAQPPHLDVLSFGPSADPGGIERLPLGSIDEMPELPVGHTVRWINVAGLGDAGMLREVGERFDIHPLVLEDIASAWQRPKVEMYDEFLFITSRLPIGKERGQGADDDDSRQNDAERPVLATQQVAMCLGADFLITFLEHEDRVFDAVRMRLTRRTARLRKMGTDYLAYAILDATIDAFFPLLEDYGEEVEALESQVIEQPSIQQIGQIHSLKRNLFTARRVVWPLRDMLNVMIRDESPLISDDTKLYLRDCYDHTIQLLDIIETSREIATGLVDILLSSQSNRMNEIMKVLTIIATIFIPLSWIAGVYGMNFDTKSPWNMPELGWQYGYIGAMIVMLVIGVGLLAWFWHKGWIGSAKS